MKINKQQICPICLTVFNVQNKEEYPFVWYDSKTRKPRWYFDRESCLMKYKKQIRLLKGAGLK